MSRRSRLQLLFLLMFPLMVSADLRSDLAECAALGDDGKRLACFDALAGTEARPADEPRPITDDVGRDREEEIEKQAMTYTVNVTSCKASGTTRRLYFYLDNGQVWRQQNDRYISARNCKSPGTISKDFFGYELYVEGMDRTIRVSRVQ